MRSIVVVALALAIASISLVSTASSASGKVLTAKNQGVFTAFDGLPMTQPTGTLLSGVVDRDSNPSVVCCTAALAMPPRHGSVTVNSNGSYSYSPDSSYTGKDSFTYVLMDSGGNVSNPATVQIFVNLRIGYLSQISCTDTAYCVAVGSIGLQAENSVTASSNDGAAIATSNGGASWYSLIPPHTTTNTTGSPLFNALSLTTVDCLHGTGDCWMAGKNCELSDFATINLGDNWSRNGASSCNPPSFVANNIHCNDSLDCWLTVTTAGAATTSLYTSTDGGKSWSAKTPAGWETYSYSCSSPVNCQHNLLTSGGWANDESCVSTSACVAVASNLGAFASSTNEGPWSTVSGVPSGVGSSISCVSALDCWAAGGSPATIVVTKDGGATWQTELALTEDPSSAFSKIDCIDATDCWAVGSIAANGDALIYVTRDGQTWVPVTIPTNSAPLNLNDIDCITATNCWAVGGYSSGAGSATSYDGASISHIVVSSAGSATAGLDHVTVSATGGVDGVDAATVSQYGRDPVGGLFGLTNFFDVALSRGSAFSHLVLSDCNSVTPTTELMWWNPAEKSGNGAWEPVMGDPGPTFANGCITATLDAKTNPSVSQLAGTVFGTSGVPRPVTVGFVLGHPLDLTGIVALRALAKLLAPGSLLAIDGFAPHDKGLALRRATVVGNYLSGLVRRLRLKTGTVTTTGKNQVVVTTLRL